MTWFFVAGSLVGLATWFSPLAWFSGGWRLVLSVAGGWFAWRAGGDVWCSYSIPLAVLVPAEGYLRPTAGRRERVRD